MRSQNEENSYSFALNKGDDMRKNSEIPMNTFTLVGKKALGSQEFSQSTEQQFQKQQLQFIQPNRDQQDSNSDRSSQSKEGIEKIAGMKKLLLERNDRNSEEEQEINKNVFVSILIILAAVTVSGLKGTGFLMVKIEEDSHFVLRAFWRQLLTSILFIPLVYKEYRDEKLNEIEDLRLYSRENLLNLKNLRNVVFCGFLYAIWIGTLAIAVFETTITNAYIFNNIFPLFLVIAKFATSNNHSNSRLPTTANPINNNINTPMNYIDSSKQSSSKQQSNSSQSGLSTWMNNHNTNKTELFGAVLAIFVLVGIASEDTSAMSAELIALVGAMSAALYQYSLQSIVYELPWMFAVLLLSSTASMFLGLYTLFFENSTFTFEEIDGIFGVFTEKWLPLNLVISLLTGLASVYLFQAMSQRVSSFVVDIAIMSEAFAALFLAWVFDYEAIPSDTHQIILLVYIVALTLLAQGKSNASVQEIHLEEQQLKTDYPVMNGQIPQEMQKYQEFTGEGSQNTGQPVAGATNQYVPPPMNNPVNNNFNRNTIVNYENEMQMAEIYKQNVLRKVSAFTYQPPGKPQGSFYKNEEMTELSPRASNKKNDLSSNHGKSPKDSLQLTIQHAWSPTTKQRTQNSKTPSLQLIDCQQQSQGK